MARSAREHQGLWVGRRERLAHELERRHVGRILGAANAPDLDLVEQRPEEEERAAGRSGPSQLPVPPGKATTEISCRLPREIMERSGLGESSHHAFLRPRRPLRASATSSWLASKHQEPSRSLAVTSQLSSAIFVASNTASRKGEEVGGGVKVGMGARPTIAPKKRISIDPVRASRSGLSHEAASFFGDFGPTQPYRLACRRQADSVFARSNPPQHLPAASIHPAVNNKIGLRTHLTHRISRRLFVSSSPEPLSRANTNSQWRPSRSTRRARPEKQRKEDIRIEGERIDNAYE